MKDTLIKSFEDRVRASFKRVKADVRRLEGRLSLFREALERIKDALAETPTREEFTGAVQRLNAMLTRIEKQMLSRDALKSIENRLLRKLQAVERISKEVRDARSLDTSLKKLEDVVRENEQIITTLRGQADETRMLLEKISADVTRLTDLFDTQAKDIEGKITQKQEKEKKEVYRRIDKQEKEFRQWFDRVEKTIRRLEAGMLSEEAFVKAMRAYEGRVDQALSKIEHLEKRFDEWVKQRDTYVEKKISGMMRAWEREAPFVTTDEMNKKIEEFNRVLEKVALRKEVLDLFREAEKKDILPLSRDVARLSKQMQEISQNMEKRIAREVDRAVQSFEKTLIPRIESQIIKHSDQHVGEKLSKLLPQQVKDVLDRELYSRLKPMEERLKHAEDIVKRVESLEEKAEHTEKLEGQVRELNVYFTDLEEEVKSLVNDLATVKAAPALQPQAQDQLGRLSELGETLDFVKREVDFLRQTAAVKEDVELIREDLAKDILGRVKEEVLKEVDQIISDVVKKMISSDQLHRLEEAVRELDGVKQAVSEVMPTLSLLRTFDERLKKLEGSLDKIRAEMLSVEAQSLHEVEVVKALKEEIEAVRADAARVAEGFEHDIARMNERLAVLSEEVRVVSERLSKLGGASAAHRLTPPKRQNDDSEEASAKWSGKSKERSSKTTMSASEEDTAQQKTTKKVDGKKKGGLLSRVKEFFIEDDEPLY